MMNFCPGWVSGTLRIRFPEQLLKITKSKVWFMQLFTVHAIVHFWACACQETHTLELLKKETTEGSEFTYVLRGMAGEIVLEYSSRTGGQMNSGPDADPPDDSGRLQVGLEGCE
ncbi:hypothetical protein KIL84_023036 [Mauremys mutica]|uniref:Uncharacterized protein n=1 Tax=Mauremys mutica TaxID=74926 RepID=A0A9D4ALS5_9SAUR|nr:hypothetical protein KIL84_023036 [Mauremys mutica]